MEEKKTSSLGESDRTGCGYGTKRAQPPPPIIVPEIYLTGRICVSGPNSFAQATARKEENGKSIQELTEKAVRVGNVSPTQQAENRLHYPQTGTTTFTDVMRRANASPEKKLETHVDADVNTDREADNARQKEYMRMLEDQQDVNTMRGKIETEKEPKLLKLMGQIPDTPKEGHPPGGYIQKMDFRPLQRSHSKATLPSSESREKTPKKKLFGMTLPDFISTNITEAMPVMPPKALKTPGATPPAKTSNKRKLLGHLRAPPQSFKPKDSRKPILEPLPPKVFSPGSRMRTHHRNSSSPSRSKTFGSASPRKPIPDFAPTLSRGYSSSDISSVQGLLAFQPIPSLPRKGSYSPEEWGMVNSAPTPPLKDSVPFGGYKSVEQIGRSPTKSLVRSPSKAPAKTLSPQKPEPIETVPKCVMEQGDRVAATAKQKTKQADVDTLKALDPVGWINNPHIDPNYVSSTFARLSKQQTSIPEGTRSVIAVDHGKLIQGQSIKSAYPLFDNAEVPQEIPWFSSSSDASAEDSGQEPPKQSHRRAESSPEKRSLGALALTHEKKVDTQPEMLKPVAYVPVKAARTKNTGREPEPRGEVVYICPAQDVSKMAKKSDDGLYPVALLPNVYMSSKVMTVEKAKDKKPESNDNNRPASSPPATSNTAASSGQKYKPKTTPVSLIHPTLRPENTMAHSAVEVSSSVQRHDQAAEKTLQENKVQETRKDDQQDYQHGGGVGLEPDRSSSQLMEMLKGENTLRASYPQFQPQNPASSSHHHALNAPSQMQSDPAQSSSASTTRITPIHTQHSLHMQETPSPTVFPMPVPKPHLNMNDHFFMTNAHMDTMALTMHDHITACHKQSDQAVTDRHGQMLALLDLQYDHVKTQMTVIREKADHNSSQIHSLSQQLDSLMEFIKLEVVGTLHAQLAKMADMEQMIKELQNVVGEVHKSAVEQKTYFGSSTHTLPTPLSRNIQVYDGGNPGREAIFNGPAGTPEARSHLSNYWGRSSSGKEHNHPFAGSNPYNSSPVSYNNANNAIPGYPSYAYGQGSDQQYSGYAQGPVPSK